MITAIIIGTKATNFTATLDELLHRSVLHSQTVDLSLSSMHLLLNITVVPPQDLVTTSFDEALKF